MLTEEDRVIRYNLGPDFLDLRTIGMQVQFKVGDKPVKDFKLIEKHFFKDTLIKSYEFDFKFCIPDTTNTWEEIYELPELTEEMKIEIIENPYETKSDSFFYVGDTLIIHQRCLYSYAP